SDLNKTYVKQRVLSSDPIIVGYYDPVNLYFALDGNHRVYNQYRQNPEALIDAYILTPKYHLHAMESEKFKLLYKIHHNVVVYLNYLHGNIPWPHPFRIYMNRRLYWL